MKYIVFKDHYGFDLPILFPDAWTHSYVSHHLKDMNLSMKPVSAGFVTIWDSGGYDSCVNAYGESISLGLKSREEDSGIILKSFSNPL